MLDMKKFLMISVKIVAFKVETKSPRKRKK